MRKSTSLTSRARTSHGSGPKQPSRPSGISKELVSAEFRVAVQHHRSSARAVAILVDISGDRGHAGDAEVP